MSVSTSGLRKTRFFQNNPIDLFSLGLKKKRFLLFRKKQDIVRLRKTKKKTFGIGFLHHPISPFSELHNNNLL